MLETPKAMEQKNSSVLGLNKRDGNNKKKQIAGGLTGIAVEGNGSTSPVGGQSTATPTLELQCFSLILKMKCNLMLKD